MHNWIARFLIVIALGGCDELADSHTEGATLATLRGTISLGPDVESPVGTLRVSVLWHDARFEEKSRTSEADDIPCEDGELSGWRIETSLLEQPVRVDTKFPSGFTVQLTEPPPVDALYDYPDVRGVSVARGDLIVYDDRNDNGRLDPSTVDAKSPDLVYGSGKGSLPWGVGPRVHYSILYLTRDLAPDEGDDQAGFSIVTTEPDGKGGSGRTVEVGRLSDAKLELVLDPTHYVQQMACSVLCSGAPKVQQPIDIASPEAFFARPAGELVPTDLGVGTSVWSLKDGDATTLSRGRCTKKIREDGWTEYSFDLDVVTVEGCTESGSGLGASMDVFGDEPFELPCEDVLVVDDDGFLIDP
jgi:hypothetical protein